MDIRMPRLDGLAATRRIIAEHDDPRRVDALTTSTRLASSRYGASTATSVLPTPVGSTTCAGSSDVERCAAMA